MKIRSLQEIIRSRILKRVPLLRSMVAWVIQNKYLFLIGLYLFYRVSMAIGSMLPWVSPFLFALVILGLQVYFSPLSYSYLIRYWTGEEGKEGLPLFGIPMYRFIGWLWISSWVLWLLWSLVPFAGLILFSALSVFSQALLIQGWGERFPGKPAKRIKMLALSLWVMGALSALNETLLGFFFLPFLLGTFGFHYFRHWILSSCQGKD